MSQNGKSVRATLGPKILANVGRYFTNDLAVIAAELLQNCRRAGAASVAIHLDAGANEITVADDGCGLAAEDAGTLLTFGGSANPDVVEFDEAPAGMGFFALAMRGARVRSRDWEMTVPPGAFTGAEDARTEAARGPIDGMRVSFPAEVDRGSGRRAAAEVFRKAAAFMPFRTHVDGVPVQRRRLADWLRAPAPTQDEPVAHVDAISASVGDSLVVVARYEDGAERWARRGRPVDDDDDDAWLAVYADIFGQILKVPMDLVLDYAPVLELAPESALVALRHDEAMRWPMVPGYIATIEAVGQDTMKARLPDRGALVRTPELSAVMTAITDLVTELAARAPRNGVARTAWPRHIAARNGIAMPAPQARGFIASAGLRRGFEIGTGHARCSRPPTLALVAESGGEVYRVDALGPDDTLLQAVDPEPALEQALFRVAARRRILVSHGDRFEGIEALFSAIVVVVGRRIALEVGADQRPSAQPRWPTGVVVDDDLTLELTTSAGEELHLPLDFIVGDEHDECGLPAIIARRSASIAAIMREAAPDLDEGADFALCAMALRRRLTTAMRSRAQHAAEVVRDALVDAGLADGSDLVAMHAERDEARGLARLSVRMADGSSATLDLDPDATIWGD